LYDVSNTGVPNTGGSSRTRCSAFALLTLLVVAGSGCLTARPKPLRGSSVASDSVVVLRNGRNAIDLIGDGSRGEVLVAWRGNYNGHGHSTAVFSVLAEGDLGSEPMWLLVPFIGGDSSGSARDVFTTWQGADCTLEDLRVIGRRAASVEVIIARRPLVGSFADTAQVRFHWYMLRRNAQEIPGWPTYYFERTKSTVAKRQYCDVNEAFRRELGLGTTGLGYGEGGR
jgi:hypothetical protein